MQLKKSFNKFIIDKKIMSIQHTWEWDFVIRNQKKILPEVNF